MLSIAFDIAMGMLAVAMLLNLFRLIKGPDLADRVIALDTKFLITFFLCITTPISAHLLAKVALHRRVPGSERYSPQQQSN